MDEVTKREPSWVSWTLIILVLVLIVYPLSFGPVVYLCARSTAEPRWLWTGIGCVYLPVMILIHESPELISEPAEAYTDWWEERGTVTVVEPTDPHVRN